MTLVRWHNIQMAMFRWLPVPQNDLRDIGLTGSNVIDWGFRNLWREWVDQKSICANRSICWVDQGRVYIFKVRLRDKVHVKIQAFVVAFVWIECDCWSRWSGRRNHIVFVDVWITCTQTDTRTHRHPSCSTDFQHCPTNIASLYEGMSVRPSVRWSVRNA